MKTHLLLLYKFVAPGVLLIFEIINSLSSLKRFSFIIEEINTYFYNLKNNSDPTTDRTFPSKSCQHWGIKESQRQFREKHQKKMKPPVAKQQTWSENISRLHLPGFWRNWKVGQWKTFRKNQQDGVAYFGCLSKLVDFLLNLQVRTCSVAVPGTSCNNNSENWGTTGDRSLGNFCLEAMFSACNSSNLSNSELDEAYHTVTGVREVIPYCSKGTSSGKQKKARSTSQLQIRSENTSATIATDQILPLNHWRRTVIHPIWTTTSTESRSCPNPLQRQCPLFTGNQRSSNCLKICSKQVSKSTIKKRKKSK